MPRGSGLSEDGAGCVLDHELVAEHVGDGAGDLDPGLPGQLANRRLGRERRASKRYEKSPMSPPSAMSTAEEARAEGLVTIGARKLRIRERSSIGRRARPARQSAR